MSKNAYNTSKAIIVIGILAIDRELGKAYVKASGSACDPSFDKRFRSSSLEAVIG